MTKKLKKKEDFKNTLLEQIKERELRKKELQEKEKFADIEAERKAIAEMERMKKVVEEEERQKKLKQQQLYEDNVRLVSQKDSSQRRMSNTVKGDFISPPLPPKSPKLDFPSNDPFQTQTKAFNFNQDLHNHPSNIGMFSKTYNDPIGEHNKPSDPFPASPLI